MWLPTPIYERIPQFWFLLGLLFISIGLYVGLDFPLFFAYIIVGFLCCVHGIGIFLVRQFYRTPEAAPEAAPEPAAAANTE